MAVITPAAVATMLHGKPEGTMVFVRIEEPPGSSYEGRVMDLQEFSHDPKKAVMTVQATDGEEVPRVPVRWISRIDVRPFQRFPICTVERFVAEFGRDA